MTQQPDTSLTLHVGLNDSVIVESEEVSLGVVLNYNEMDVVVGIEMLCLAALHSKEM